MTELTIKVNCQGLYCYKCNRYFMGMGKCVCQVFYAELTAVKGGGFFRCKACLKAGNDEYSEAISEILP